MASSTTTRRRAAAKKPSAPPAVEEIEDLDEDEVDEDEVEEVEEEKPKAAAKKAAKGKPAKGKAEKAPAKEVTNGTQWLAAHVNEQLSTEYKPYDLRVILRKMAKDGSLDRAVGDDRSRYDFSGPNDPVVRALIKALKSGDLERERKAKLDALKEGRGPAKGKGKKATAPADDEVDEDLTDEDEVDELDDEE